MNALDRIREIEKYVESLERRQDSKQDGEDFRYLLRAFQTMSALYCNHLIANGTDTLSATLLVETEFEEAMARESAPKP